MEVMEKGQAWNKGKLIGQKPPLKPKISGRFEFTFRTRMQFATESR